MNPWRSMVCKASNNCRYFQIFFRRRFHVFLFDFRSRFYIIFSIYFDNNLHNKLVFSCFIPKYIFCHPVDNSSVFYGFCFVFFNLFHSKFIDKYPYIINSTSENFCISFSKLFYITVELSNRFIRFKCLTNILFHIGKWFFDPFDTSSHNSIWIRVRNKSHENIPLHMRFFNPSVLQLWLWYNFCFLTMLVLFSDHPFLSTNGQEMNCNDFLQSEYIYLLTNCKYVKLSIYIYVCAILWLILFLI